MAVDGTRCEEREEFLLGLIVVGFPILTLVVGQGELVGDYLGFEDVALTHFQRGVE